MVREKVDIDTLPCKCLISHVQSVVFSEFGKDDTSNIHDLEVFYKSCRATRLVENN